MTTYSASIDVSSFTTDAKFRTWGSTISAGLTAVGLTQTADTGQINWASVTKPVATGTQAGYEIWRFNDTLHSTKPIFIRIGYGSGAVASGNSASTWITVGTGTDGAGNITGINTGLIAHAQQTVAPSNTAAPVNICYNSTVGYLWIWSGRMDSNYPSAFWVVNRTSDASGAATGTGIAVYKQSTASSFLMTAQYLNFTNGQSYSSVAPRCGVVSTTSAATGAVVPLYKHYAAMPDFYPLNGMLTYFSTDMVDFSTFTAAPFGATSRLFLAIGSRATGMDSAAGASNYGAFLWE